MGSSQLPYVAVLRPGTLCSESKIYQTQVFCQVLRIIVMRYNTLYFGVPL